ncbi:hypothetical protein E4T56_gene6607, partial [Termitomyces sp. T112]
YGLTALEPERVTARQIEAARRAIQRHLRRQGRLWIRVFPDLPVSKKPAEVRQGKGKGSIEYWAARVKPGKILFELDGVSGELAAAWRHLAPGRRIMTKIADLRAKSDDQLVAELGDLKREAFNLRFQAATNQLERPARIKEVRRDIARIKTLQS